MTVGGISQIFDVIILPAKINMQKISVPPIHLIVHFVSSFLAAMIPVSMMAQQIVSATDQLRKKVELVVTSASGHKLLERQQINVSGTPLVADLPVIKIDTTKVFQNIEGFGFTLTEASALVINRLPESRKTELLRSSLVQKTHRLPSVTCGLGWEQLT